MFSYVTVNTAFTRSFDNLCCQYKPRCDPLLYKRALHKIRRWHSQRKCWNLLHTEFLSICCFVSATFSRRRMTSSVHHIHSIKPALHNHVNVLSAYLALHNVAFMMSVGGRRSLDSCLIMMYFDVLTPHLTALDVKQSEVLVGVCFSYLSLNFQELLFSENILLIVKVL